jgi:hypothetical protein
MTKPGCYNPGNQTVVVVVPVYSPLSGKGKSTAEPGNLIIMGRENDPGMYADLIVRKPLHTSTHLCDNYLCKISHFLEMIRTEM